MQDFMLVEMKDASSFFTQSFMVMGICFSACIFPCGQAYMRFAAVGAGSNQLRRGMARDGPVQLVMDRGVNSIKKLGHASLRQPQGLILETSTRTSPSDPV